MICFMSGQSRLRILTIFFYTCVWIPFLQIKQALLKIFGFTFCKFHHDPACLQDDFSLPVAMFGDLASRDGCRVDEMCPICLVDFGREDAVTQLFLCGHIFHMGCIQGWLDSFQFTCPLCRSCILNVEACQAKCAYPLI